MMQQKWNGMSFYTVVDRYKIPRIRGGRPRCTHLDVFIVPFHGRGGNIVPLLSGIIDTPLSLHEIYLENHFSSGQKNKRCTTRPDKYGRVVLVTFKT